MEAPSAQPSLTDLREELARIDRELVRLFGARLRAAQSAVRLRVASGEPLTDREQEQRVRDRAHRWAVEFGVPPELVDRLLRELIDRGKAGVERSPPARGHLRPVSTADPLPSVP